MDPDAFAAHCRETARTMRRLPADVRRAIRARAKPEVAEPMAADIRGAGTGVYARRVAPLTKARAAESPRIVAGTARRVVSGGAKGRQLVYGSNFGGGGRRTAVPAGNGHRGYRRRSTEQFRGRQEPWVFGTVGRNLPRYLERWADIITDTVDKETPDG